jgi:DMSO/TMAO reductase YedYZ molybdopterin-dependent catalytic subunit
MKERNLRRKACGCIMLWVMVCLTTLLPVDMPFSQLTTLAIAAAEPEGGACHPPSITVPALPKIIPGYAELDRETGLHVTGTLPTIDFQQYSLDVTGKVNRPLHLTYDDLRCMPKVKARPQLVCPGFFVDVATWAGTPLKHILEKAGVQAGAKEVRLTSADQYFVILSLRQAMSDSAFIAYEWEGKPLPLLHGFPVRAILPGLEGNMWVKWLITIEVR